MTIPTFRPAAILATVLWLAPVQAQTTDHLGVPGPITFGGESFALAWSSDPTDTYIKQEYVLPGETPDSYSRMVLVETVTGGIAVRDAVRAQTDTLAERKKADPLVNMEVVQNEATGEALLDFIVSSRNESGEYTVEWNAYRYAPLAAGDGGPGVMLFGVSHRASGNDAAKAFLQDLPTLRPAQIEALAGAPLPEPGG